MLESFFWVLLYLSLLAVIINIYFAEILEVVVLALALDLIAIFFLISKGNDGENENIDGYLHMKLDSIERVCDQIMKRVFNPETEKRLERDKKDVIKWLEEF